MKYWAYTNNEVGGPFEKEQLAKLPNFTGASLICPETTAGGQTPDWKEASTYPEVSAILTLPAPPPSKPRYPESESPLALTMRGSLISDEALAKPAEEKPAPAVTPVPAPTTPKRPAESPLAMTMRGTLIEPVVTEPATATPAAFSLTPITAIKPATIEPPKETPKPVVPDKPQAISENIPASQGPDPRLEPLKQKVEQVGGALAMIRNSQAQLLEELKQLESAVAEIRALLSSEPPKK